MRIREGIVGCRRISLHASASRQPGLHLAEAHPGSLVEGPVRHDDIGHTRGDGHRRVQHGPARGTPAVARLGEELQITDAGRSRNRGLVVGVHRKRREAIDIRRAQACVIEGVEHRLGRQPQLATTGVLREIGGTDANDGRLAR